MNPPRTSRDAPDARDDASDTDRPPGFAVVRALAWLVPHDRRADWLAEWHGELAWSARDAERRAEPPARTAARLVLRSLGATTDALWLRLHDDTPMTLPLDVRYALRSLSRRPGFALVTMLTLALGIGATTAIFSVVDGVLLRPLALPEPDRVVRVEGVATGGALEKVGASSSYPDYEDMRARARGFAELAAIRTWQTTLVAPGTEPARLEVAFVTDNWARTLGTPPALGRPIGADDVKPGAAEVVLLSDRLWRRRYGGDAGVVGRAVTLDGAPVTVVGVMPANPIVRDVDLWRPFVPSPIDRARGAHRLTIVGRLAPTATLAGVQAEISAIARALEAQYPESNTQRGAHVASLRDEMVAPVRPALLVLLAAVALVLVVGCTNLAGLLLARAASREREMAVRAALGAGRGHLLRQWMAESFLLTLGGGLAGAGVAWVGMRALLLLAPRTIPRAEEVTIDGRVLLFLAAVSVATGLLFGALPAFARGSRSQGGYQSLRDARAATAGRTRRRARHVLVTAEIALATVLVSGAGLLTQGLWRLTHTDLRFEPAGLAVVQLHLPETRYDTAARVTLAYDAIRARVAALPTVRAASLAYGHPLDPQWTSSYVIVGEPAPRVGAEPEATLRPVSPGYFRAAGVRLLRGRDVAATDQLNTPGVTVVNSAFARRHFGSANPLGRRVDRREPWWPGQPTTFEIVGVVDDEPFMGRGSAPGPALYFPHAQFPMADMWLVVAHAAQGERGLAALDAAVRRAVWSVDPQLPVEPLRAMSDLVAESSAEPRFNALLLSLFAGAALLLAALGVYGVLSYTVAQRRAEIGVRIALGAARGQVVRGVVLEGLALAAVGLALGVPAALATGRVLAAALSGVEAVDPAVLAAVVVTLLVVAVGSAFAPAWRASRVDPVSALRDG